MQYRPGSTHWPLARHRTKGDARSFDRSGQGSRFGPGLANIGEMNEGKVIVEAGVYEELTVARWSRTPV